MPLKYSLYFSILLVFTTTIVQAQDSDIKKFFIEAGPEYQSENFHWSIAGNEQGTNPNILSELKFSALNRVGFYTAGGYRFSRSFSVSAHYHQLYTFSGNATDFDYNGDNRTNPKSQLYLQSNKGYTRTATANAHYHFLNRNNLQLTGSAGYNFTKELYYLTDDNNDLLNTTYETNWKGPNIGVKGQWNFYRFMAMAGITSRYLYYNASANWNLIEEFKHPVSFTHTAEGSGFDYNLQVAYRFTDFMTVSLEGLYGHWKTNAGLDKLYQADGQVIRARLNGAHKANGGIRLTAGFTF